MGKKNFFLRGSLFFKWFRAASAPMARSFGGEELPAPALAEEDVPRYYLELSMDDHVLEDSSAKFISCAARRPQFLQRARNLETWHAHHGRQEQYNAIEQFKQSLSFPSATHEIKDLQHELPDVRVVLHGYLGAQTILSKKLCFVPLFSRDLEHCIQIVSATDGATESKIIAHAALLGLQAHIPVAVKGSLKARKASTAETLGDAKKITAHELDLQSIQPLNDFPGDIIMTPEAIFPPEQRHLQLRQEKRLRNALQMRSRAASLCRQSLENAGFTEVETPVLFKQTPEGAREFFVPTRRPGLAYALPQSPQQYKQILMSSGISRYYQLARCFRDEDLRADRQPEFTQLDLEMSFASGEDVMQLTEALVAKIWSQLLGVSLVTPFPRLSYQEAMTKFGSDKPDLRLGMEISRLDHLLPIDLMSKISGLTMPIVEGLFLSFSEVKVGASESRRFISEFLDSPTGQVFRENPDGAPGVFIYDSSKPLHGLQALGFEAAEEVERLFEPNDGDLIILQAKSNTEATGSATMLGNLRLAIHRMAVSKGYKRSPKGFAPLWVNDFPLFSASTMNEPGQGGSAGLTSTHHPFTSPKTTADVDLLTTDPSKVIADHYDLIINGVELGGGSRRIHNAAMQRFVMKEVLQMSETKIADFEHLLEALRAGCPPHAGIALGFDRMVAVMVGTESIRDVIAFPKSNRGEDMLVHSPSALSKETLDSYHLSLKDGY